MKRLGTVRRRVGAALAMGSALTVVLTIGVHPTFASWVSTAKLGDSLGVASSSCTTPGVYRTSASSRLLAGSVAGIPLTSSSALAPLTAVNNAATVTFPAGATAQGGDGATSTVTNAAAANAVQAAGGMAALSGPSGSQTQYAAATSTGRSVAGSGAVTTAGAIDAAGIAAHTRPEIGAVDVSSVLAAVPGGAAARGSLSQLGLSLGDAASTATLNECARRWGASLSSALARSATVSSMSLSTRAAAVTDLVTAVGQGNDTVGQKVTQITGVGGATSGTETAIGTAACSDLVTALQNVLGVLSTLLGTPTTTVTVSTDLSGATSAAQLRTTGASGAVELDGASGKISVDLAGLAGTTTPAPNTQVIGPGTTSTIAAGVSTASGALVDAVSSSWDAALAGTTITVDVVVPLLGLGTVRSTLSGSAAAFAAGTETVVGPIVTLLPGAILPVGLDLTAITSIAPSLLRASSKSVVATQIVSALNSTITTAKATLSTALATARALEPTQLAALSTLFSITLNEQPDVAPYPSAAPGTGGGFVVTALRVRVKVAGADALDLAIASSSVGPDHTINE